MGFSSITTSKALLRTKATLGDSGEREEASEKGNDECKDERDAHCSFLDTGCQ